MARAVTAKFEEFVLEVETNTPGTYALVCGLTDVTINRSANIDTTEIPDCDNEALPYAVDRSVRSIEVSVSATGVWAQSSNDMLNDWLYSGTTKNIRVRNTRAAVGDTETEAGPALLATLTNARAKGQAVTAEIEIQFNGTPTRTNKAA